jgi:hypothetical protein
VPFVVAIAGIVASEGTDKMQRHADNLNDVDKITHRKWTIAICLIYGLVFTGLIGLAVMNVPNDQVAMSNVSNIIGSLKISAK